MRIEHKAGAGVAALGALLLAMSGAAPAFAHSGPSARLARAAGLSFADPANSTSTGFGGWVFKATAAKSVTAEYKVPTLKCGTATAGVGPIAVFATGTSSAPKFNAAGLLLECSGGSPAAAAAVVVDGTATTGTKAPHAGDLIQVTIVSSTTKTTATVKDLTAGHTFTLTKSGAGAAPLQEQIIDDSLATSSGAQLPVANFGKITFTKGAVSGKAIGSVSPRTGVNMQTSKGVLQILTGAISGTAKNTFLTTWKHS